MVVTMKISKFSLSIINQTKMRKQKETVLINGLWRIRRALGLERKQVARLLGHRSTDAISRYERGICLPGLKTVVKLTIIYQAPLEQFFPEHFDRYRSELEIGVSRMPKSLISLKSQQTLSENVHHCTYEKLLEKLPPTRDDLDTVRNHITKLAKAHLHF
jgi:transcriptional regulator with XRE-family HTH domain